LTIARLSKQLASALVWVFLLLSFSSNADSNIGIKRTILALYDSAIDLDVRDSIIHRYAEMPLNHLGLKVIYWDIQNGMPVLQETNTIRGVLFWAQENNLVNPSAFFSWANSAIHSGIRFVIFGNPLKLKDQQGHLVSKTMANQLLRHFGVKAENVIFDLTYKSSVVKKDPNVLEFERSLQGIIPDYGKFVKIDDRIQSFLVLRYANDPKNDSHVVVANLQGGLVDDGFILYKIPQTKMTYWQLNPFTYFEYAYATKNMPKPDPTTHANRRIFYYYIAGDGWREKSNISHYKDLQFSNAKVVFESIIKNYSDIPITVAPIIADLDPNWVGKNKNREVLKDWFSYPNVEIANHTYSHPNKWNKFNAVNAVNQAEQLQTLIKLNSKIQNLFSLEEFPSKESNEDRKYQLFPFNLSQEIITSSEYLNQLLADKDKVRLLQWTGDMRPSENVLATVANNTLLNINGGFPFSDNLCCSLTAYPSFGVNIGSYYQVYASNYEYFESNGKSLNANKMSDMLRFTELPRRLKPISIYHKMFVGGSLASLNQLKRMLDFIRSQEIIALTTTQFVSNVNGFNNVDIAQLGVNHWKIRNRGTLQTIRIDDASLLTVDFGLAIGVIGQRHVNNTLYVFLDNMVDSPEIILKDNAIAGSKQSKRPYLIHASWNVEALDIMDNGDFNFITSGFEKSDMLWKVNQSGIYSISVYVDNSLVWQNQIQVFSNKLLNLKISLDTNKPVLVKIRQNNTDKKV